MRPSSQCVICDATLGKKDIIELNREGEPFWFSLFFAHLLISELPGTGFASGGIAETSKTGIAFQG